MPFAGILPGSIVSFESNSNGPQARCVGKDPPSGVAITQRGNEPLSLKYPLNPLIPPPASWGSSGGNHVAQGATFEPGEGAGNMPMGYESYKPRGGGPVSSQLPPYHPPPSYQTSMVTLQHVQGSVSMLQDARVAGNGAVEGL